MKNFSVFVTGQTGSGKTTLAHYLLARTPRFVILDPEATYRVGDPYESFADLIDVYSEALKTNAPTFGFRYTGSSEAGYRALMHWIYETQAMATRPAVALVVEEASLFSDSKNIPTELDWLLRAGRKHRINVLSIAQSDVDVNPVIRRQSKGMVAMRQIAVSSEFRRFFTPEKLERLQGLTDLTPGTVPVEGTHYLMYPDTLDLVAEWTAAVGMTGDEFNDPPPEITV